MHSSKLEISADTTTVLGPQSGASADTVNETVSVPAYAVPFFFFRLQPPECVFPIGVESLRVFEART